MKIRIIQHTTRSYAVGFLALFLLVSATLSVAHNNVVVVPMAGDDLRTEYEIGKTGPAGGIVFYVTDGGLSGLEAAPTDVSTVVWGCTTTLVLSIDAVIDAATPDSNGGAHNTQEIINAGCGGGGAAVLADAYEGPNGITTGWYLPNKEELELLFQQKDAVGNFSSEFYWSSTQNSATNAWVKSFGNTGNRGAGMKSTTFKMRVIRAF